MIATGSTSLQSEPGQAHSCNQMHENHDRVLSAADKGQLSFQAGNTLVDPSARRRRRLSALSAHRPPPTA